MHFISDDQIQRIRDTIIGVNVILGDNDFGNVIDIEVEIDNGNVALFAKTDSDFYFNAFELYQLYRKIYAVASDKVYPEGSEYAKRAVGPKSKAWNGGGPAMAAQIPNTARIGNESVNISKRPY